LAARSFLAPSKGSTPAHNQLHVQCFYFLRTNELANPACSGG
jgi:hypothetical protein